MAGGQAQTQAVGEPGLRLSPLLTCAQLTRACLCLLLCDATHKQLDYTAFVNCKRAYVGDGNGKSCDALRNQVLHCYSKSYCSEVSQAVNKLCGGLRRDTSLSPSLARSVSLRARMQRPDWQAGWPLARSLLLSFLPIRSRRRTSGATTWR